jgi:formate-nitrite transporter family protein
VTRRDDHEPRDPATPEPFKSHRLIFDQEATQAVQELQRPVRGLFLSGLIAGFGVGLGVLTGAGILTHGGADLPQLVTRMLVANALTIGFIVVIMARTDLFTEYTTIAILPVLEGRAPVTALVRLWALVYVSNLAGAAAFGLLLLTLGRHLEAFDPDAVMYLLGPVLEAPSWVVLLSALFTGWLMGLLSWLLTAGRDSVSQIFFIWLITGVIAFGRLPHAISGAIELFVVLFSPGTERLANAGRVLAWTTMGNAAGGVLFAVLIWSSVLISGSGKEGRR